MFRIKNDLLSIGIHPTGAELCSLKNLRTNTEYTWQADPDVWNSHAPVLFPVIGVLKNGTYYYRGESYKIPKHGIIRHNNNLRLKEQDNRRIVLELKHSEETMKVYPFRFLFEISFTLEARTLLISHTVKNLDDHLCFSPSEHILHSMFLFVRMKNTKITTSNSTEKWICLHTF